MSSFFLYYPNRKWRGSSKRKTLTDDEVKKYFHRQTMNEAYRLELYHCEKIFAIFINHDIDFSFLHISGSVEEESRAERGKKEDEKGEKKKKTRSITVISLLSSLPFSFSLFAKRFFFSV